MLRRVALVRTDFSEELSASFIRVIRIAELGTTLAVTSNRRFYLQHKVSCLVSWFWVAQDRGKGMVVILKILTLWGLLENNPAQFGSYG
jgi:hypothetical protein